MQAVHTWTPHGDYVSGMTWHEPQQSLLSVSGDGTLARMDPRAKKVSYMQHGEIGKGCGARGGLSEGLARARGTFSSPRGDCYWRRYPAALGTCVPHSCHALPRLMQVKNKSDDDVDDELLSVVVVKSGRKVCTSFGVFFHRPFAISSSFMWRRIMGEWG